MKVAAPQPPQQSATPLIPVVSCRDDIYIVNILNPGLSLESTKKQGFQQFIYQPKRYRRPRKNISSRHLNRARNKRLCLAIGAAVLTIAAAAITTEIIATAFFEKFPPHPHC
ncbi:MAG: hypothetical protein HN411_05745 [Waddliaceae bacterium]|jgi:hypothetical protein|nr:hypothetical protein [Waddliaceae bacterium]MBT3578394.1 hypothetical protein [Waddliaceae bacterium]MBT4445280.1 hypothetical protein [Waddliaceae bacterium]MBT6928551.1 hypothetical protein [Waddliaceae bacterium]MBT7264269.1 hypothetical protein [Waddliaceae bacterium]